MYPSCTYFRNCILYLHILVQDSTGERAAEGQGAGLRRGRRVPCQAHGLPEAGGSGARPRVVAGHWRNHDLG